eukprot:SAG22_NODE_14_length_33165_cov_13.196698_33_plen_93_part_00
MALFEYANQLSSDCRNRPFIGRSIPFRFGSYIVMDNAIAIAKAIAPQQLEELDSFDGGELSVGRQLEFEQQPVVPVRVGLAQGRLDGQTADC